MKIAPVYYNSFSCIKGECRHTCCAEWEIDIDEKTLNKYENLQDKIGDKIRNNIYIDDDGAHFKMCENGKCPLLNNDGLCQIILELGEGYISDICHLHPRYINTFEHHTEIGVGMCCQAACRLVLTSDSTLSVLDGEMDVQDIFKLYNGTECETFKQRNDILDMLDRYSASESRKKVLEAVGVELEFQETIKLINIYKQAEILDEAWRKLLDIGQDKRVDEMILSDGVTDSLWKRIVKYFIFRYLAQANNSFETEEYILFSIISADFICSLSHIFKQRYQDNMLDAVSDISRMYSSEIEYSSDNIEIIIDGIYSLE